MTRSTRARRSNRRKNLASRDHPVRDEVREDAGGIEAGKAGEGEERIEIHRSVDLGEEEPGPVIEVQPHHLLGLDGEAGHADQRPELRLVHGDEGGFVLAKVVASIGVVGVDLDDFLDELQRPGEVAQREELLRRLHPDVHLLLSGVLCLGQSRPIRNERPYVGLVRHRVQVQPAFRLQDEGGRRGRPLVPGRWAKSSGTAPGGEGSGTGAAEPLAPPVGVGRGTAEGSGTKPVAPPWMSRR